MSMNPQDEVTFVLETVRENWPDLGDSGLYGEALYGDGIYYDDDGFPADLARINRDEPEILETGERSRSLELSNWNAVGASLATRSTTPRGTEYDHNVETVVSIRVEGLHGSEWGQIESAAAFAGLVKRIKWAILSERSYPDVMPDADDIGWVCYQDLRVENDQDLSSDDKNYFRRDFDVRLTGVEELPDL